MSFANMLSTLSCLVAGMCYTNKLALPKPSFSSLVTYEPDISESVINLCAEQSNLTQRVTREFTTFIIIISIT